MIISASRRTDIPAYYADWFLNRLRAGFVYVRNPINPRQISQVMLAPDVVDGIVFWTKNPLPMLGRLAEMGDYPFYFQFTLNTYGRDVEPNIPQKDEVLIPAFRQLSSKIGREKVVWRYDPILFNQTYTMDYHLKAFKWLAQKLADYTEKCTVSFLDFYQKTERNTAPLGLVMPSLAQKAALIQRFAEIAKEAGLALDTCAEAAGFEKFGIPPARCIDPERFERIGQYQLSVGKDKNQRPACGCAESVDIGAYDTCQSGCRYCYANRSPKAVTQNCRRYDPDSPLLCGEVAEGDVVRTRPPKSLKASAH